MNIIGHKIDVIANIKKTLQKICKIIMKHDITLVIYDLWHIKLTIKHDACSPVYTKSHVKAVEWQAHMSG